MNLAIVFTLLISASGLAKPTGLVEGSLLVDFQQLASRQMAGRKPGTEGHKIAQNYIIQRFSELGLEAILPNYQQAFVRESWLKKITGVNLVGLIRGQRFSDKYIVITAHYDHLGQKAQRLYLGADDNASGVAAMLELARQFSQIKPQYSYLFVATDQEERGLYGAKYFVENPPVSMASLVLNVNLDMISRRGKKNRLYVAGTHKRPALQTALTQVADLFNTDHFTLLKGHDRRRLKTAQRAKDEVDWYRASDHYAFATKRIPYVYFGGDTHHDYHQVGDTFENADLTFFQNSTAAIVQFVAIIDQLDTW